jgi:hypothetical protein
MRPWHLIAPDWGALDTIWRSPQPFILWPVCEKPLLSYWLDEAVRQGVPSLSIEVVDRPHLVRQWLDQRDLWSRSIQIQSQPGHGEDKDCFLMNTLPGEPDATPVQSAKELMQRWYGLQVEALRRRASGMVHLDHEYRPGIWFGPGTRAATDVAFTPPCWVGSHANIGPGCRIGPHAFIGPGVFLDGDVEVSESVVCAETYVGSHTTLKRMAAQGGLLMDFERGIGVEIVDDFVLSPLGAAKAGPSWAVRIVAALVAGPLEWLARRVNGGNPPVTSTVVLGRSRALALPTYASGALCLRRSPWLRQVAAGNLRLTGVLPRGAKDWETLPPEAQSALKDAPVGVFALSDLYGCHSPEEPDEWMHAVFQAGAPHGAGQRLAKRSLLKIAMTTPAQP